jgi:hypothetical protein
VKRLMECPKDLEDNHNLVEFADWGFLLITANDILVMLQKFLKTFFEAVWIPGVICLGFGVFLFSLIHFFGNRLGWGAIAVGAPLLFLPFAFADIVVMAAIYAALKSRIGKGGAVGVSVSFGVCLVLYLASGTGPGSPLQHYLHLRWVGEIQCLVFRCPGF